MTKNGKKYIEPEISDQTQQKWVNTEDYVVWTSTRNIRRLSFATHAQKTHSQIWLISHTRSCQMEWFHRLKRRKEAY